MERSYDDRLGLPLTCTVSVAVVHDKSIGAEFKNSIGIEAESARATQFASHAPQTAAEAWSRRCRSDASAWHSRLYWQSFAFSDQCGGQRSYDLAHGACPTTLRHARARAWAARRVRWLGVGTRLRLIVKYAPAAHCALIEYLAQQLSRLSTRCTFQLHVAH